MKNGMSVALAAALFAATPAMAEDVPQPASTFNCDFAPDCEVAPGVYGSLSAPSSSKFKLSVGGYVKLESAYNSNNYGPNGYQSASQQPKRGSLGAEKDQFTFSSRTSRLWFKAAGPTLLGGKTSSLVEFDFANSVANTAAGTSSTSENASPTPRLRHAYGIIDWGKTQLLFGQTTNNFNMFTPNTIDFNGGLSTGYGSSTRIPQLKLTQRVALSDKNSIQLVFALEQPYQSNFQNNAKNIAAGNTVGGAATGDSWGATPNVAAQALLVSKALGMSPTGGGMGQKALTAGLFGTYGNQHGLGQTNDKTIDSWGIGFYTFVPVLASEGKKRANTISVEAQAYLAANLNTYTAAQYTGAAGNLQPAKGFGVAASLQYFATDQLSLNTGFGRRQARNYDNYKNIANYERYNEMAFLNVFYDLNAAIRVGMEYEHLETRYGSVSAGTSKEGITNIGRMALYYYF